MTNTITIRKVVEYIAGALVAILAIDALGFTSWVASGQMPADSFYIGSLTAHILRAIL